MNKFLLILLLASPGYGQVMRQNGNNATGLSGTVDVDNGGTGATSFTQGGILYGNGTSAVGASSTLQTDAAGALTARSSATITDQLFVQSTTTIYGQILVGTNTSTYQAEFVSNRNADRLNIVNTHTTAGTASLQLSNFVANSRNWLLSSNFDTTGGMSIRVSNATQGDPYAAGLTALAFSSGGDATVTATLTQAGAKNCSTGVVSTSTGALSGCLASDQKLKKNIGSISYKPHLIDQLHAVYYEWKDKGRGPGGHAGFIAQEVEKVFPLAVVPAGDGLKGIDPNAINAALLLEIQNLRKRVAVLENK